MEEVSKTGGRTVLFVSHNMASIKALCNKGILLSKGTIEYNGSADEAVNRYLDLAVAEVSTEKNWNVQSAPGNAAIRLKSIEITPTHGDIVSVDSGARLTVRFRNHKIAARIGFNIRLLTKEDIIVFESGKVVTPNADSEEGVYTVTVDIPPSLLNSNLYKVKLYFGDSGTLICDLPDDLFIFEVHNSVRIGENPNQIPGVIKPRLGFDIGFEPALTNVI
jgi:lipopolysaccharide transport system ATP-binding protein